ELESGTLRLLLIAPERFANAVFTERLARVQIALMAIDEAHCISEWGHNFRPDYLKLANLRRRWGVQRVLALTATATPQVASDIRAAFDIEPDDQVQTGFRRQNLHFFITPCHAKEREALLVSRLREAGEGPTIVYVTLQQTAEALAGRLSREGFNAKAYHAGLTDEWRKEVQDGFMSGRFQIIVATIAFGMGIDKADIRSVYHFNLPKSLENFVQESGRAGRDGAPAHCEILACANDRIVLENFVYGDSPSPQALRSLVEHLMLRGETFSISRYDLAGTKDIRPMVVATALAYLELDEILIPTGSHHAGCRIRLLQPEHRILAGHDPERRALIESLLSQAKESGFRMTIDLERAAEKTGTTITAVRETLRQLAELGDLTVQPTHLRQDYRRSPDVAADIPAVVSKLRQLFLRREESEILRLRQVIDFCETGDCLTRHLLSYFGESMEEDCGTCGNCLQKKTSSHSLPCSVIDDISVEDLLVIQALISEKHGALRQARQMARFLCGIISPAAARERLLTHDAFGLLAQVPFQTVLTQVESMLLT
ncbi:MAG: RecQ family ATP-dependent DNA helicase, partial [Verrucomicrobiae bacterium]|nr:RecQ family ATP-dependent DNA helicase [Verrucomicrobiae bacterium]